MRQYPLLLSDASDVAVSAMLNHRGRPVALCLARYTAVNCIVAASGPTIWTSTYGLEPVLCNRLLIEPSGWAQTVHMFTKRLT